jgi:hypothetical protein
MCKITIVRRLTLLWISALSLSVSIVFILWPTPSPPVNKVSNPDSFLRKSEVKFPVRVVFWTKWFGDTNFYERTFTNENCPYPSEIPIRPKKSAADSQAWCQSTHKRSLVSDAIFIGFHVRDLDLNDLPPQRRPGQLWLLTTQESPPNDFARISGASYLDLLRMFDLSMTYRLDSDIPFLYIDRWKMSEMISSPLPVEISRKRSQFRDGKASVLWVGSNCNAFNGRTAYLKELMRHVKVDSLGGCLRNGEFPIDGNDLIELMSQYKFYLAVENSNCKDYVTEKLYNALAAGVIPIVSGPTGDGSGYSAFLPTRESALYLDEYPDPKELARVIREIDRDDQLWNDRMWYRRANRRKEEEDRRFNPEFLKTWMRISKEELYDWGLCGMCRRAARQQWSYSQLNNSIISGSHILPDYSCKPRNYLQNLMTLP